MTFLITLSLVSLASAQQITVRVGKSPGATRSVNVHGIGEVSNEPANPQNPNWGDTFSNSISDGKLTVQRTDADSGWGQQLVFNGQIADGETMIPVDVGGSPGATKTVPVPEGVDRVGETPLNEQDGGWNDRFETTVTDGQVEVKRVDSNSGWGQPLQMPGWLKMEVQEVVQESLDKDWKDLSDKDKKTLGGDEAAFEEMKTAALSASVGASREQSWFTPKQQAELIRQADGDAAAGEHNKNPACSSKDVGNMCPPIECIEPLAAMIIGEGCCPVCWAPDHIVEVDRHTTVNNPHENKEMTSRTAPANCDGVRCFNLTCNENKQVEMAGRCCKVCQD